MKKEKLLISTNWWLLNSHRNVKYGVGNIVNNIIITTYSAEWVLEMSKEFFVKYMIV